MIALSAEKHRCKEAVNHQYSRCAAAACLARLGSAQLGLARISSAEGTQAERWTGGPVCSPLAAG